MKAPLLVVMGVVVLVAGSGLAIMNNACKSSHHGWCAPVSDVRHHVKTQLTNRAPGASPPTSLCSDGRYRGSDQSLTGHRHHGPTEWPGRRQRPPLCVALFLCHRRKA